MTNAKRAILAALLALVACLPLAGCAADAVGEPAASQAQRESPSVVSALDDAQPVQGVSGRVGVTGAPDFSITFLDVGQGDAAIVSCDGHHMIVDGGPPDASQLMYTYCRDNGIESVDYLVATHSDTDHAGGISGALQVVNVGRAFCSTAHSDKKAFQSMERYLGAQDVTIEVPQVGETLELGRASVQVVGLGYTSDSNDSIVLRITYGSTSFLLAGDASEDEERAIVDSGIGIESDLLKVAHHGSAGSSCYRFLRAVNPQVAVISVGAGNSYGHPTEAALSRLRDCDATVYRTDMQGDVVVTSDGANVTVTPSRNAGANTLAFDEGDRQQAEGLTYIGNRRSQKFHLPTCKNLPAEKNRVSFESREEAVGAGYTACGNCKP